MCSSWKIRSSGQQSGLCSGSLLAGICLSCDQSCSGLEMSRAIQERACLSAAVQQTGKTQSSQWIHLQVHVQHWGLRWQWGGRVLFTLGNISLITFSV